MHAPGGLPGSRILQSVNGGLSSRSTASLPCCRLLLAHQVSCTRRRHPAHLTMAAAAYPDVVPYVSTRAPKLRSRSIFGNPLHWGWSAAAVAATRLELLSAVWVDRFSNIGPPAVAVLAGALAGLGTTPWALLKHGMPAALQDQLLMTFGIWDTSLLNLALAVISAPVALWAVRCWWVANMQLCTHPAGLVQQLLQAASRSKEQQRQQQEGEGQQAPIQHQQQDVVSSWLAALLMLVRLWCLKLAATTVTTLVAGGHAGYQALHAAAAVAAAAVAAAPLLWPVSTHNSSSSSSSSSTLPTAAALLAAEAGCVTCAASPVPMISAAAGCVMAGSLLLLHNRLVAPRLSIFQAHVGDAAEVHVALKLQGSTAVFDSTQQEQPLQLLLQSVSPELRQVWQEASSTAYWEDGAGPDQPPEDAAVADNIGKQAAAAAAAAGSDGGGTNKDSNTDSRDLYTIQQGIQRWLQDPAARWDALSPFIADTAAGMYLGQTKTVAVYNPLNVGYWNPRFTWWQPTADVIEKFKGETPKVGEVFWYPVADGAHVPTRIQNVGEHYVELDANYGVAGTMLQLDVQLVRLYKPADAAPVDAADSRIKAEAAGAAAE